MALPIGLHNKNKWRCYMNAVIQALLTFDEFNETVHRVLLACQDVPERKWSKDRVRQFNLTMELHLLLRDLRHSAEHSTGKFFELLQRVHRSFERGEQQDAQELLVVLCTSITELNQLAGSQLKLPTKFNIVSAIECRGCNNTLQKVEETDWITVNIPTDGSTSHAEWSPIQEWRKPGDMNGDDRPRCEKCEASHDAIQTYSVSEPLPNILVLHMNIFRAKLDSDGNYSQRKVLGHLNVPKTIDVSELGIDQPTRRRDESTCYQLESVVVHIGRHMSSGHYVCMRRRASGWLMFNDEEVTERTLESVLGEENNPYLLFYRRQTN
ncbi:Protein USP-3 [Aphelenchoides avenae]|nr:Protein USP-3 [Aphelenchus avenae]